jgi:hypothetical protein
MCSRDEIIILKWELNVSSVWNSNIGQRDGNKGTSLKGADILLHSFSTSALDMLRVASFKSQPLYPPGKTKRVTFGHGTG